MKKPKVLITGSTSFVGGFILEELLKSKYNVISLIRKRSNKSGVKEHLFNIDDKKSIENAVKNSDYIIHLVAITNPHDKNIYDVNVGFTKTLVDLSKKYKIKNFIYISSFNVNTNFNDKYTLTKKKAEFFVKSLDNFVILRPSIIYGFGDEKYIGKFVRIIKKFHIFPLFGNGKQFVYLLYARDLAKIVVNSLKLKSGKIYNLLGNKISYKDLIILISKKIKSKFIFIPVPIFLVKFLFNLQKKFMKPFITESQINYLSSTNFNFKDNIFKFNYTEISKGLDFMFRK